MELSKINSLVELFFTKYKELNSTSNKPFLKWLKDNKKDFLTWKQVERNIQILSEYLRKNLSKGDRCILLSENRPEWLISDIAIMNAGGVTVPLFTTSIPEPLNVKAYRPPLIVPVLVTVAFACNAIVSYG